VADELIAWGSACRLYPGEVECGDACLVEPQGSQVLVAVVDGLGHGSPAAAASTAAIAAIRAHRERGLPEVMRAAHDAMTGTRGAAVTLGRFVADGVELLAIGNVAGVVMRSGGDQRRVPLRGGIVGFRIPSLGQVDRTELQPGDHVVLASDGIRSAFPAHVDRALAPQEIADEILKQCGRDTDDATVFVARFEGES
jgi:negative regulator of sigma-B (phosphoserine phosphatase)